MELNNQANKANYNRYIVLDTETTGLSAKNGDRVVEIGCVELVELRPTFNTFHTYINPEREMSPGAQAVHGLSTNFLSQYKNFKEVAQDFLKFIDGATLIIHNAKFDMGFLNHEMNLMGLSQLNNEVIDTLSLAKKLYPGSRVNLDALCKRFNVDLTERGDKGHGALLDAKLLTEVYLQMISKREDNEAFSDQKERKTDESLSFQNMLKATLTPEEQEQYKQFMNDL